MKKVFTLLALLMCVLATYAGEIEVVLDRTTAQTGFGKPSPWIFSSNGVEVRVTNNKSMNMWYEDNETLKNYPIYHENVDFTITVPVNFIPSKIAFKGLTNDSKNNTSLLFNNDYTNKKQFNKLGEEMTTCEFSWPKGEKSAVFHVTDNEHNLELAATITITGELKPYYATMAKNGFCTFSADKNVWVGNDVSIKLVSQYNKNINQISVVNSSEKIVTANTGVILQGEPNQTYYFEETSNSPTFTQKNMLKYEAKTVDNNYTFVLICNKNNDAQFARLKNGSTIPAGKAYLEIPELATNSVSSLSLYFADVTGIHEVKANDKADDNYYSLDGQKLSARPDHGTYIHQGHVYMAK